MSGPRGVVYAMLLAFTIFVLSGQQGSRRFLNATAKLTGQPAAAPTAGETPLGVQAVFAWAVLFVIFIGASDIDATAELASAFAFLLLISVLLVFGPDAFATLNKLFSPSPTSTQTDRNSGTTI